MTKDGRRDLTRRPERWPAAAVAATAAIATTANQPSKNERR